MILLLDNYDSFTFNLYQLCAPIAPDLRVIRNDALSVDEILALSPEKIIISPGPGRPEDAGITIELIRKTPPEIPILGICLGHQAITVAFGGRVIHAPEPVHGKSKPVILDSGCPLFVGLPSMINAGRYHSLIAEPESLPEVLMTTALSEDGLIMSLMHRSRPIFGLQFHPESILTPLGPEILRSFLENI